MELHGGDDEVTAAGGSNGIVEWEHVSSKIFLQKVWAMWLAIRHWMAVGIPSEQSFVLSVGSLWRQKR